MIQLTKNALTELRECQAELDFVRDQLHRELCVTGGCAFRTCRGTEGAGWKSHTGEDCPLSQGRHYGPGREEQEHGG